MGQPKTLTRPSRQRKRQRQHLAAGDFQPVLACPDGSCATVVYAAVAACVAAATIVGAFVFGSVIVRVFTPGIHS